MSTTTENDFPTWFPPALVKELRQGLRTPAFMITLALIPVAMSLLFMGGFIKDRYDDPFIPADGVNVIFWLIICFALLAIFPLRALHSVKGEVSSRTADLLVLTRLTPWRIVWGKWTSYMSQAMLTVCSLLPFLFVRYYYGSVNIVEDLYWLALIVLLSGTVTAMSIWMSGMPAFLKTPFTLALFVLAGFMLAMVMDSGVQTQEDGVWLALTYVAVSAAFICAVFLILASKFFSLPSDNISRRLRWTIVAFIASIAVFLAIMAGNHPDIELLPATILCSLVILVLVFILELMDPQPFLPSIVARKGTSNMPVITNLLFVPGFFSAALFSLLMMGLAVTTWVTLWFIDGNVYLHDVTRIILYASMLWSGMVITGYFLMPFQKRLKGGIQFIYLLSIGILIGISGLLQFWDLDPLAMIVPWGNLVVDPFVERIGGQDCFSTYYVTIIALMFVAACIFTVRASIPWRKTIRKAKQLDYLEK